MKKMPGKKQGDSHHLV